MQIPFDVDVVLCIESPLLQPRLSDLVLPDAAIIDNCGDFSFSVHHVTSPDDAVTAIRDAQAQRRGLILVSDRLVDVGAGGYAPSRFALHCRDLIVKGAHSAGALVALVEGEVARTTDIAGMVDIRGDAALEAIREEVRRVADGIWLKSNIALPDKRSETDAIQVGLARQTKELAQAFHLRHRVYRALGYLDASAIRDPGELELDQFDTGALHFVAVDRREGVVGTARLITDASQSNSSLLPSHTMKKQRSLIARIVEDEPIGDNSSVGIRRRRTRDRPFTPFPILENSDFQDRWPEFLQTFPAADGGELSRLVVAPRYRGLGVSSLLMRAVIAFATEMKKRYLILECVAQHVSMYERYGFRTLAGHHCRAQDVDQIAVGMSLDLREVADRVGRDLKMLQCTAGLPGKNPFLCSCRTRSCSEHGEYFERGKAVCPLKREFELRPVALR